MPPLESTLIDIGRIGMGVVFLLSTLIDIKARTVVFSMMKQKNVPAPWFFFIGGITWKAITSIAIICNFYTFWAALILALYIFIANLIFNNFWAVPKEKRDFSMTLFLVYLASCFGLLVISSIPNL